MTERICIDHEKVGCFFGRIAVRHAEDLLNFQITSEQLVDTVGWDDSHMAEILDVLASELRRTRSPEVVMTAFGADVEPSEEFRRGVEDGIKSCKVFNVAFGLVCFAVGVFVALLPLVIGGAA